MNSPSISPNLGTAQLPAPTPFLSPATILRAVRKRWVVILVTFALAVVATLAYTAKQKKIYEAAATVQLDPQTFLPLGNQPGESGPESFWSNQEYFATQHQILTSRRVAGMVARKLGLHRDAAFIGGAEPGAKPAPVQISLDSAAEILRSRLKVKPIQDSRLAVVTYRDADPDRAQRILSATLDTYVEQNLDASLDSANKRAEWLDTQLVKLKAELEAQEMDLHDFKKTNNLLSVSFDDQSNMLRAEIQQLNGTLTELKARREKVAARLRVLEEVNPQDPSVIPQGELLGSASLAQLRTDYLTAKKDVQRLMALGKGQNHPEVLAAEATLTSYRNALLTELQGVREGAAKDLQSVQTELAGVTTLFENAKSQALGLNINEVRFTRLRRTKDNTERIFGLVLERSTESGLSKLMPFNNVRVLDRPLKPGGPVSPRPLANLAVGVALGLLLGLVGAIGREFLDRTVRGVDDAEQELGLPSLGSLPEISDRSARQSLYYGRYGKERGATQKKNPDEVAAADPHIAAEFIVHSHPKSSAAEAARAVRTNLLFMSPDHPYRSLIVTSAGPAEGKTTVACSIAIAMSQAGQRVCLVDCDLRRPRIHTLFTRPIERGLTTALLDLDNLEHHLTETMVPNLWALPAGPTPPNPADLMHSEAFARLLELLKSKFDRLVIDSPPVCLVTDAVVASTRVDATVLVIRALKTSKDGARRAIRSLRDVGATLPGFVLNAVSPVGERYAYSYYRPYEQTEEEKAAQQS